MIAKNKNQTYNLNIYDDLRCICDNLIHISGLGRVKCEECRRIYTIEEERGYCYSCGKQMPYTIDKDGLRKCIECKTYIIDK